MTKISKESKDNRDNRVKPGAIVNPAHLGVMVWLVHHFGFERKIELREIAEFASKRPESVRYHILALEDMGLLSVDRRHRPHVIRLNKGEWVEISTPKCNNDTVK